MIDIKITYTDFEPSEAVSATIQKKAQKLEQFYQPITACEAVVSAPHHHKSKGNPYHIQLKVHIPGKELVVNKGNDQNESHEDVYNVIRDAFKAMQKQLESIHGKRRSDHDSSASLNHSDLNKALKLDEE